MISGFSFLSGANFGELVFDLAIDRTLPLPRRKPSPEGEAGNCFPSGGTLSAKCSSCHRKGHKLAANPLPPPPGRTSRSLERDFQCQLNGPRIVGTGDVPKVAGSERVLDLR